MDVAVGARVDRYVLGEQLGAGGQAEVWRAAEALHPHSSRAIKLVQVARVPPSRLARVRREAQELEQLRHPSLVRCFGLFEDNQRGLLGAVMELVEGRPLSELLGSSRLDERLRVLLLHHLADALAHVHRHGLVHRDVKLENVLVSDAFFRTPEEPSTIKLIDFGIAVEASNPHPLTCAGHVVGTAPYLAPEQLEPGYWGTRPHAASSDVFSFGILAWRLLENDAAAHPARLLSRFDLEGYALAYRRAEHERWPPPSSKPRYQAFFRRALALRAWDRLDDGSAIGAELENLSTLDEPPAESLRAVTVLEGPAPTSPERTLDVTVTESPPGRRTSTLALWIFLGIALVVCVSAGCLLARSPATDDSLPPLPTAVGR